MMNLLAMSLVISSLIAAHLWSPVPGKSLDKKEDEVIVKEGHRIIVVESYDKDGRHNTKVSISPGQQHDDISQSIDPGGKFKSNMIENAGERIREASHGLPNIGQAIYGSQKHPPGEIICDAFGKCTRKFASVIGEAKEEVCDDINETVQEVIAKEREIAPEAKEKVEDLYEKAKEGASKKAHEAKEMVEEAYESAAYKAHDVKESVKESLTEAKGSAAHKAHDVKESAKEALTKAKEVVMRAKDLGKTMGVHVAHNLTKQMENTKELMSETAKEAKEKTQEALNSLMGLANLMGFATSFGMCVWVTFISSYVLARALPRQQFALVQSKIYPVYFRAMSYSIGLALLGHLIGKRKLLVTAMAELLQVYNLLIALLMVLFNGLYLEPLATKVMLERMKIEKEEGRGRESQATEADQQQATDPAGASPTSVEGPAMARELSERDEAKSRMVRLSGKLKKLNSCSSLLNVLTLMSLCCHMVYLSHSLNVIC